MNDLIDHINQDSFTGLEDDVVVDSDAGAREDPARICPMCGDGGFSAPACTGCGLVYESTKVSFPPAEDAPRWYQQFARKVAPLNIPEYWDINEAALLAGWSDKVLERAALTYTKHYAAQRVTDPVALFRKLVIDATGKDSAKAPVTSGRKDQRRKYSEDFLRRRR